MATSTKLLSLALLSSLGLVGCGTEAPSQNDCSGDKCDDLDLPDSEIADSPCDGILEDLSGRGHEKVAGRLHDPVAEKVFMGDSCPTGFEEIMKALQAAEDDSDCGNNKGINTRAVSETAQITGEATSYRLVTTKRCGATPNHRVMFSLFGVRAGASSLPENVEIIAFDETNGVFNYYETGGGSISFFGNSADMLEGSQGEIRRCAACHTGGGLVMKELDTPWLHWEGHMDTPGARELVDAHSDLLGSKSSGADMESLVKGANRQWNEKRLELMKERGDTAELLRPLFCSVEVNLDNGADFESPPEGGDGGSKIGRLPTDSLFDPKIQGGSSISIEFDDYDSLIKANGQNVPGIPNAVDTVFDYVFIERSHADTDYVDKLKSDGIVNDEFIRDVLMVDFTRPIFSDDRCDLLQFAPQLAADDLSPAALTEGFIANLQASGAPEGSPAAELLTNLQNDGGHRDTVSAFVNTCKERNTSEKITVDVNGESKEVSAFLADAMAVTSLNRRLAGSLPVFEFPQTMPVDDLNVAQGTRLHPTSCELTTDFVAVAEAQPAAPAELNSCEGRCGLFNPEASCQCNDICLDAGDCCSDFEAVCQAE